MMIRHLLLLAPLLLATPALAQQGDAEDPTAIVVTGTPLSETAGRLAACLARKCPPREDIAASLAHAENQFIAGDYTGSRATLRAAHIRNQQYGKQYPVEVANLDRAYGRLTNLNGYPERGRIIQIGALDTLKAGLGSEDARVLVQRIATGDEYVMLGRLDAADEVYRRVEKQARESGQIQIAGFAMLRQAAVMSAIATDYYPYRTDARAKIRRLEATTEPELAEYRAAARILRARLAAKWNEKGDFSKVIGELGGMRMRRPVLLYTPTIKLNEARSVDPRNINSDPQWIDVRFRIDADGTVQDVEVLHRSDNAAGRWSDAVVQGVTKRRYAPLELVQGETGLTRIERFSYVFDAGGLTGTRLPARSGNGRITSLDLTIEPADPTANKGR